MCTPATPLPHPAAPCHHPAGCVAQAHSGACGPSQHQELAWHARRRDRPRRGGGGARSRRRRRRRRRRAGARDEPRRAADDEQDWSAGPGNTQRQRATMPHRAVVHHTRHSRGAFGGSLWACLHALTPTSACADLTAHIARARALQPSPSRPIYLSHGRASSRARPPPPPRLLHRRASSHPPGVVVGSSSSATDYYY